MKAREELSRLQQETAQLEESVESGKAQLEPLQQHLQESQQEISSVSGNQQNAQRGLVCPCCNFLTPAPSSSA